MHFSPSHDIPSTYRNWTFQVTSVLGKDLYVYYLFTFHFTWSPLCNRNGTLCFNLSTTTIKCACGFVLFVFCYWTPTAFHISFSWIFRLIFFSPRFAICLLPPHQMFSNGGKQVKTPQQNATRETISTRSGEITVAGSGHWKLQQQNRGVLSFSFLFTLSGSECSELIVIKMESVTPL